MDETTTAVMLAVALAGIIGVLIGSIIVLLLDRYAVGSGRPPDEPEVASQIETIDPDQVEVLDPEPDFRRQAEDLARRAGRPEASGPIEAKLRTFHDIARSKGFFDPRKGGSR